MKRKFKLDNHNMVSAAKATITKTFRDELYIPCNVAFQYLAFNLGNPDGFERRKFVFLGGVHLELALRPHHYSTAVPNGHRTWEYLFVSPAGEWGMRFSSVWEKGLDGKRLKPLAAYSRLRQSHPDTQETRMAFLDFAKNDPQPFAGDSNFADE